LVWWLNLATSLFAQPRDLRFEHLSVEQGLSNYAVTKIVQDKQGFLWFGTADGLNKYNGYEFAVYKSAPADPNSLPSQFIQTLYVDRKGNLWVGTVDRGLWRYDPDADKFEHFESDPHNSESLTDKTVNTILEDSQDELWIGTNAGLYRYHRERDAFIIYRHDPQDTASISSNVIVTICEASAASRKTELWIGTGGGGINRYDREKNAFTHYRHHSQNSSTLNSDNVVCIREDRRGVIWIGTDSGLNRYDRQTDTVARYRYDPADPYAFGPAWVFDIYEDSHGTLWIGTIGSGLWRYEAASDRFFRYVHDPHDPYSLSENRISCIYEDPASRDVMWLGTFGHGINRCNRRQEAFARYKLDAEVFAIWQDRKGDLWIGGTNSIGLLRYDRQGKLVRRHRQEPANPDSLGSNLVFAIREDSRGDIWIGTVRGLHRYDTKRDRFVRYNHEPINPAIPTHNFVKAIYEDAAGEIWIGTAGSGLSRLNRAKMTFTHFRHDPGNPQSLSDNNVSAISEDKNGDLWIGTFDNGVNRLDRKTQTFTRYRHDPNNPHGINANSICSLSADSSGYLWIGTSGSGLNRYDPHTGRFAHYTERDGLPDNSVNGILPDTHGNLWVSTDKGLSKLVLSRTRELVPSSDSIGERLGPQITAFKNYTVKDGLINNRFRFGACHKSRNGRLFFGGEGGVIAFYPDSLKDNPHVPPVVITGFKVFDKPLPIQQALFSLDEIELSHRQNFFSLEFVALDYTVPAKNQYAYKMEGFDPDWVHAGGRRYASYTNVDPGAYVFRVKGSNGDGVWNEEGASIKIIITPPYWQTWWFRALAAMFVGAIAFGVYRYRVNQLLKEERLRTRLAADLHDEIAGNLSSIAMFGQIVEDKVGAGLDRNASESQLLHRMITLAQESVTAIREIIWAIDPKPETIYDLLVRVHDLAVNACRAQNMILQFDEPTKEQLPATNLSPEQRKHLWLLLKEAINNAIKHSGGTELAIRARYEKGSLSISIADNGAGMNGSKPSTKFSGKGLGTMQSRAEQLRGSLLVLPNPAGGTVVTVTAKI
jgi:ligand-binding sensor domain-containing protein